MSQVVLVMLLFSLFAGCGRKPTNVSKEPLVKPEAVSALVEGITTTTKYRVVFGKKLVETKRHCKLLLGLENGSEISIEGTSAPYDRCKRLSVSEKISLVYRCGWLRRNRCFWSLEDKKAL